MSGPLLECIPNFSEGRNADVIEAIAEAIRNVKEIKLLNVDPGKAANRTVMTFAGKPESVIEAAFKAIKTAATLIDMRLHKGEHPRIGATDVCPLVPVNGITKEEAKQYAERLAKRVAEELHIPVYLYEHSALHPDRANLADIRKGEYEGLAQKIKDPYWRPDYGPVEINITAGAAIIGARNFLVAYNINLDTKDVKRAKAIAADIRESGRLKKVTNDNKSGTNDLIRIPGALKYVKAIGWYIEEYNIAQLSLNLVNIDETPVHIVYEETKKIAAKYDVKVTGSELIGMIPLKCMLQAGEYYAQQQVNKEKISDKELINIAIHSLGLSDLFPFDPRQRVIEYALANR